MKKIAIILGLLLTSQAYALPQSHKGQEFELNRGTEAMRKHQVGTQITRNKVHLMRAVYDYAIGGGASTAAIDLVDYDGKPAKLPANAIIKNVWFNAVTAPASGDAGTTISFSAQAGEDLLGYVASTSFTTSAILSGKPIGTSSTAIKLSAERTIQMRVGVHELIGGKINALIEYYLTD